MNKLDLIAALKNESELTKSEAAAIVDLFFTEMANALAKGDRVEIRGLYSFYVKKRERGTSVIYLHMITDVILILYAT